MPDQNGEVEIRDFTLAPRPHKFKIDDDIFEAVPEIPLGDLGQLAKIASLKMTDEDAIVKILDIFDFLLTEESGVRFRARTTSKKNPIGQRHILPLIPWLLEIYGLRPTQPPSDSLAPSVDESGTSSTDGAEVAESTQAS